MDPISIVSLVGTVISLLVELNELLKTTVRLIRRAKAVDSALNIDVTNITSLSTLIERIECSLKEPRLELGHEDLRIIEGGVEGLRNTMEELKGVIANIVACKSKRQRHRMASKITPLQTNLDRQCNRFILSLSYVHWYVPLGS